MATSIQVKRGSTAKVAAYTPLSGELVLDTTTNKLYAGDGSTAGGKQVVASRAGVTDGSTASAGEVGQILTASGASTALTSGVQSDVINLALTAGDWDVTGVIRLIGSGSTITQIIAGTSTAASTASTFPNRDVRSGISLSGTQEFAIPLRRVNVSASTTLYLGLSVAFSGGTVTCDASQLTARRIR